MHKWLVVRIIESDSTLFERLFYNVTPATTIRILHSSYEITPSILQQSTINGGSRNRHVAMGDVTLRSSHSSTGLPFLSTMMKRSTKLNRAAKSITTLRTGPRIGI